MAVKLIVMDIDGTLLDSSGVLTEETRTAMREAKEHGILLALGTGRAADEARPLLDQMPEIEFMVAGAGSEVFDVRSMTCLCTHGMPMETVRALYEAVRNVPCLFELMTEGHVYSDRTELQNLRFYDPGYYLDVVRRTRIPVDMSAYLREREKPVSRIHFLCRCPEDCLEIRKRTSGFDLNRVSSIPVNFEINARGVDKGTGVRALAKLLNISTEDVMTLGDNENDIGMLSGFGYTTLMGNAAPAVRNLGKYMTRTNDEDGAAYAIRMAIADTMELIRKG